MHNYKKSYFLWAEDLGIPTWNFQQVSEGACPPASVQFSRFYTGQSELVNSCLTNMNCRLFGEKTLNVKLLLQLTILIHGYQLMEIRVSPGVHLMLILQMKETGTGIVWNHDQATPANPGGSIDGYAP